LLFVNKIDRAGAGEERVLRAIAARLSPAVVPMGSASGLGTRAAGFAPWGDADAGACARLAEIMAERDEGILAAYIDDELSLPYARLRQELAVQTRRALVYPVFFGSADPASRSGSRSTSARCRCTSTRPSATSPR
jgi:ribosomal protection tetracycline resistance protein